MSLARRKPFRSDDASAAMGSGPARLALRLVLGAIAEVHAMAAPEDVRASRRRWIETGSILSAARIMGRGSAWVIRLSGRWTRRIGTTFGLRGTRVLDRWARIGQSEELAGRRLLRTAAGAGIEHVARELMTRPELNELVDEILDHLADRPPQLIRLVNEITQSLIDDPDVKALIHEQSTSLLGSVVKSVRDEAARADTALERAVATLERRLKLR
jgi:hypothetical protein